MPDGSLTELMNNPKDLRNFVARHLLNYNLPVQDLKNDAVLPTIGGDPLIVSVVLGGRMILVGGVPVIAATPARNGAVYVVSKVLYSPNNQPSSRNVIDELIRRPELSTFLNYVRRTKLPQRLQGQGPFTILAPKNEAFNRLSPNARRALDRDTRAIEELVNKHIINGAHYSKELENRPTLPVGGRSAALSLKVSPDGVIVVNDASPIVDADISTGNGVIHIINRVISSDDASRSPQRIGDIRSPSQRIRDKVVQVVSRRTGESKHGLQPAITSLARGMGTDKFLSWLDKSGVLDGLPPATYTVVAPTDEAINQLPEQVQRLLESKPEKLKSLLNYHIVPWTVDTQSVQNDEALPTLSGKDIRVNRYQDGTVLTLSGAPVVNEKKKDNLAVIAVDRVLYPPQGTVLDIVAKSPVLKTLAQLIRTSGLDQELSKAGPFTLFAPHDDAFKALQPSSLTHLMSDPDSSRAFVLRHLVRSALFSSAVDKANGSKENSAMVENESGEKLAIERKPESISVNGITLSYADITATNGVLHLINNVL